MVDLSIVFCMFTRGYGIWHSWFSTGKTWYEWRFFHWPGHIKSIGARAGDSLEEGPITAGLMAHWWPMTCFLYHPLPSGPSFPIGMGWHRQSVSQGSRRIDSRWRRNTVVAAGNCFDGGGRTSSFFGWEECRKTENFQSSQAQDLAISPFSPHSPVGPIFFGGHHGHMAIASPQDAEWKACRCRSEMPSKVPSGGLVNVCFYVVERPGAGNWTHVQKGQWRGMDSHTSLIFTRSPQCVWHFHMWFSMNLTYAVFWNILLKCRISKTTATVS